MKYKLYSAPLRSRLAVRAPYLEGGSDDRATLRATNAWKFTPSVITDENGAILESNDVQHERYHVVDESGAILASYAYGYVADACAGQRSDRIANVTFTAIDTRDGSVYGAWRNGEEHISSTVLHTSSTP